MFGLLFQARAIKIHSQGIFIIDSGANGDYFLRDVFTRALNIARKIQGIGRYLNGRAAIKLRK
ncbi:hypothetical protein TUM4438_19150 [Shewanella sairae]|uniref:Uncharacterized protein n=1 Tax=Shewanella sairae TaxID=190310 RepID=A0ABQ4PDM1_9GAMM|nr:hypothetical protein TUM4438_19150 [Shewanella sairae]